MVLMSTLLNNIKELVNQYVYTKEETRENFDYFIEHNVRYINGNFIVNELYFSLFDDCTNSNVSDIWTLNGTNSNSISYTTKDTYNVLYVPNNCQISVPCKGDIKISFDYYPTNTWTWQYTNYWDDNKTGIGQTRLSSSYDVSGGTLRVANLGYNKWINAEIIYSNNTVTLYVDGVEKGSATCDYSTGTQIALSSSYPCYYKNIRGEQL